MKSANLFWILCGIWAIVPFCSVRGEGRSLDKRYIAALAKNNRLPKFSYIHKKSEESDDEPSLEETRLFLNQDMEPDNFYKETNGDAPSFLEPSTNDFLESSPFSELNILSDQAVDKRNVAALARLGRLNTIRYGRFQPHYVSGKRVSIEDGIEEDNQEISDNEIYGNDIECEPDDDEEETLSEMAAEVNGRQKKRYVAALARSGRLPIWHSQRMWSGKRDFAFPLYKSNSRIDIENNLDNFIDEVPSYTKKQKKCKKIGQNKRQKRNVDKMAEIEETPIENTNLPELSNPDEKRNLAALARNGKLPSRYFGEGKRDENSDEDDMSENLSGEKRNIASLARNGKLYNSRFEGKRNLASLARNGKLPQFNNEGKRNLASLARNGKLLISSNMEDKRNIASLARNGKIPSFNEYKGKRNLAALARNGKLPTFYDNEGKRNLAALARNGKLPSYENGKRNIQALARNNKLPAFTNYKRDSMESDDDKRNLAALAKNGRLPSFSHIDDKRNMAALAKNGRLPSFSHIDDKRNMAALAKNGRLPSFSHIDDKRNMAALAKNGKLPTFSNADDKRNMAALAKNGKLPSFHNVDDKRNLAALARNGKLPMFDSREDKRNIAALAKNGKLPSFLSPEEKRNMAALAKNGKLPSFYSPDGKRNVAALARNGKLPAFNSIEEKRQIIPVSGIYDKEDKRNVAALARKGHLTHFNDQGKKRNIAALARNGKLLRYNKRDVYTTNSLNPFEKWDDDFQDDLEM